MAATTEAPHGRTTQREPAVKEVHILWTPDGLSCDGDTVSTTAASQPSIEDIVMGAIPGLPKVHLHNRVLAYPQGGDEYMRDWHAAAEDRLDEQLRPTWLFGKTVHEGCDRAGYYEQADFGREYGTPKCIVKLGCWGPVVNCNVTKRGWMAGIGGCPNVGGICIACTMPGFPDKFMPFMDEPPGALMSSTLVGLYGRIVRGLRSLTNDTVNKEPRWRHRGR